MMTGLTSDLDLAIDYLDTGTGTGHGYNCLPPYPGPGQQNGRS